VQVMPPSLAGRLVPVEARRGKNPLPGPHSMAALGYLARSAPGRATLPRPATRSVSCCAFTRAR
jgi:hypothetical protein